MKLRPPIFAGLMIALVVRAAVAAPAAMNDPEVFLSLRGVSDETIEIGEPLFVGVRIEVPFESKTPLTLAPASGTWADRVDVVFLRGGTALSLRATPTFSPANAGITLDADHAASGEWHFPATQTSQLAAGDYAVQVRVAIRDGAGWKGEVASEPTAIRVIAVADTPARVLQRTLALANEALVAGRLQEGVRLVDTLLVDQPDNLRLLALRARFSARAGDLRAAMTCVTRAMGTEEVANLRHPPIGLFELQDEISEAMLSPAARNATPPEWTKLPPRVLEIIRPTPSATVSATTLSAPTIAPAVPAANPTVAAVVTPAPATPTGPSPVAGPVAVGIVVPVAELTETRILADANGQWAASALAGSEYSTPNYGAVQMIGPPDVPDGNDHPKAWCHHSSAKGLEWVELTFARPVRATEVRVRQTYNPGAIVKVEAIDPDGATHLWWQGIDPARPPGALNAIAWFAARVPRTDYLVAKIRLTLDLDAVVSWQEIDAVQLVGAGN